MRAPTCNRIENCCGCFVTSSGGTVDDILDEHPEWDGSANYLDETAAEREDRLLGNPRVGDAVEQRVVKYRFPLRHYFAERLLYEEPREIDFVDEDLAEYELGVLEAAEGTSDRPPLWTGFNPR